MDSDRTSDNEARPREGQQEEEEAHAADADADADADDVRDDVRDDRDHDHGGTLLHDGDHDDDHDADVDGVLPLQEVPLETDTVRQRVRTAERDTELEQEVVADADAATDWLYMDYMDPMTEVARVNLPAVEVTSQQ